MGFGWRPSHHLPPGGGGGRGTGFVSISRHGKLGRRTLSKNNILPPKPSWGSREPQHLLQWRPGKRGNHLAACNKGDIISPFSLRTKNPARSGDQFGIEAVQQSSGFYSPLSPSSTLMRVQCVRLRRHRIVTCAQPSVEVGLGYSKHVHNQVYCITIEGQ